jgi:hypothetical protein
LNGGIVVENRELNEWEKKIFQTGLFDNLTVQDSIIIVSIYAGQLNPQDCKEDLDRMVAILNSDVLFKEDQSSTLRRIYKFLNSLENVNPLNAIEKAAEGLTPELRKKAFILATQISRMTQEIRTKKILKNIASNLGIDDKISGKLKS